MGPSAATARLSAAASATPAAAARGRSSIASSGRTGRSRRPGVAFFTNSTSSSLLLPSLLLSLLLLPSLLSSPPVATCREVRPDDTWSGACGQGRQHCLWHGTHRVCKGRQLWRPASNLQEGAPRRGRPCIALAAAAARPVRCGWQQRWAARVDRLARRRCLPACSAKQLQQAARAGTPHFQTAAAACKRGSRTADGLDEANRRRGCTLTLWPVCRRASRRRPSVQHAAAARSIASRCVCHVATARLLLPAVRNHHLLSLPVMRWSEAPPRLPQAERRSPPQVDRPLLSQALPAQFDSLPHWYGDQLPESKIGSIFGMQVPGEDAAGGPPSPRRRRLGIGALA